jgi:hypothetical protein
MDLSRITEIAREHYITAVERNHGSEGTEVVRSLFTRVKQIHEIVDYESISGALTVFELVNESSIGVDHAPYRLSGVQEIALHNSGTLTIQVLDNNEILLWKNDVLPVDLPSSAIVYRYEPGKGEKVWVEGSERNASLHGFPRLFGNPAFLDLADALDHYRIHIARPSECAYLLKAWREEGRVMWRAKPEETMRLSVYQFLKSSLRNGRPDVHQEAPVDARNPVDITVRWADSNRIAVIEIKWIGKSGTLDPLTLKTEYREKRAQDGLRQLVDYLDLTKARTPLYESRGYLVVFDGRRRDVKVDDEQCHRENGLAFVDAHISYDQDLLDRHDMEKPFRLFCEPKWVFASPSKGG